MKYCTDCRHFDSRNEWRPFDMCYNRDARDLVGRFIEAERVRAPNGLCGPEAKLFELKPLPIPETRVSWWQRILGRTAR